MRQSVCIAILLAIAFARADAGEVVETYEDGSLRVRYSLDESGRKHGRYVERHRSGKTAVEAWYLAGLLDGIRTDFHENGRPQARSVYKQGKRDGKHEMWDASGRPLVVATYRQDRLEGKAERWIDGQTRVVQTWREGRLLSIDGVATHPRPRDEVLATVDRILAGTDASGPPAKPGRPPRDQPPPRAPTGNDDYAKALRRLRAYRYACAVPYADVTLDPDMTRFAEAAAAICARLGDITHEPRNPGLPEAQYRFAFEGTKSSNLHQGCSASESVDGYMDDSDPTNVARVGHRRWCLHPAMLRTGFGNARNDAGKCFTAMWARDASRTAPPPYSPVCYPARGYMPAGLFGPAHAWSVCFDPDKHPLFDATRPRVRVWRLGADYVRPMTPLDMTSVVVSTDRFGLGHCLIFRPKGVELVEAASYWVEVDGMDGTAKKPAALRYLVEFAGAPPRDEPAPADEADLEPSTD